MSLLPAKIFHHMKKTVTFGQKFHAHPFVWNEKLSRPELCRSKSNRFIWLTNIGITTFYFSFLFIQCFRVNLITDFNSSKMMKIYMRFVVLNYVFLVFGQLANFVNRNQLPGFNSQFSTLMKQFEGKEKLRTRNQKMK